MLLLQDFDGLEVIGTANPYNGEADQSGGTSQMLMEMERQPVTEMEMLVEDDDDDEEFTGFVNYISFFSSYLSKTHTNVHEC